MLWPVTIGGFPDSHFSLQPMIIISCSPLSVAVLFAVYCGLVTPAARAEERTNIVMFLVDDLGYADIGCYGSSFYDTPHVDRLAAEGARFTSGYAENPVCSPTRAALMTGKYSARTDITTFIGAQQPVKWNRNTSALPAPYTEQLALGERTIAEALKEGGYTTFYAGKWHLGPEGFWPEDQGFDYNYGGHNRGGPYGGDKYFSPYGNPRLKDGPQGEHLTDRLATETADFISAHKDEPFFALLSFYSVHTPLIAREDLTEKYLARRAVLPELAEEQLWGRDRLRKVRLVQEHAIYAAMVEAMDLAVGKVLARIDELGLASNTLVIFTSDNGGLSTSEGHPTSNLPLRAGKGWLYEGGIRVPYIVRWKDSIPASTTVDVPASTIDFYPTFLAAAGLEPAADQLLDGLNLLPFLTGGAPAPERDLFWHFPNYGNQGGFPGTVIRRGPHKLIEYHEDESVALYHLDNDLSEQTDLAGEHPELVGDLRDAIRDWRRDTEARLPTPNPNFDPGKSPDHAAQFRFEP